MKKALFIGSVYPTSMLNELLESGEHIDFAANTFQSGLIEGLSGFYDHFIIVSSPVTSAYPKSKHLYFKRKCCDIDNKEKIALIRSAFVNIPFIKMIYEYFEIKRLIKKYCDTNTTVYVYALHSPFLMAVLRCKESFRTSCLIVPDLPEYMSHNNGILRKVLKSINKEIINRCLNVFDNFILLSPYMREKYPILGKRWIQVEGIFAPAKNTSFGNVESYLGKKTILYTGVISEKYGVFDLIRAFSLIKSEEYVLLLCGGCRTEKRAFEKLLSNDHRIKYLGLLSKDQVRYLQSCVTLLINPRHSSDDYTKYSFPSKTMEYLASGTPTVMAHLPAIPLEYDEFLFYFDDESLGGISKKIIEICNMDCQILKERGERARQFILNNKSASIQSQRIYSLVEGHK